MMKKKIEYKRSRILINPEAWEKLGEYCKKEGFIKERKIGQIIEDFIIAKE